MFLFINCIKILFNRPIAEDWKVQIHKKNDNHLHPDIFSFGTIIKMPRPNIEDIMGCHG